MENRSETSLETISVEEIKKHRTFLEDAKKDYDELKGNIDARQKLVDHVARYFDERPYLKDILTYCPGGSPSFTAIFFEQLNNRKMFKDSIETYMVGLDYFLDEKQKATPKEGTA